MKDVELLSKAWKVNSGTVTFNGKLATYTRWVGYASVVGMGSWGFWQVLDLSSVTYPSLIWLTTLIAATTLYEKVGRPSITRQIAYKLEDERLTLTANANLPSIWLSRLFSGLSVLSIIVAIIILSFGFVLGVEPSIAGVIACLFVIWQSQKLFNPTYWQFIEHTLDFKLIKKSNSRVWLKSNLGSMQIHLFSTLSLSPMTLCFSDENELKLVRKLLVERYPEMVRVVDSKPILKWVF